MGHLASQYFCVCTQVAGTPMTVGTAFPGAKGCRKLLLESITIKALLLAEDVQPFLQGEHQ